MSKNIVAASKTNNSESAKTTPRRRGRGQQPTKAQLWEAIAMLKAELEAEKSKNAAKNTTPKATPKPAKKPAKKPAVKAVETVANTAKTAAPKADDYESINALVRVRDSWVSARKNEGDIHLITFADEVCGWYNAARKVLNIGESALAETPCLGKIAAQFVRKQPWFEGFGGWKNRQAALATC